MCYYLLVLDFVLLFVLLSVDVWCEIVKGIKEIMVIFYNYYFIWGV